MDTAVRKSSRPPKPKKKDEDEIISINSDSNHA